MSTVRSRISNAGKLIIGKISTTYFMIHLSTLTLLITFKNQIFGFVLQSNKGLDLTDESHYLLSATNAQIGKSWSWPYGWSTSILFKISDENISLFRINGALLLILTGYGIGLAIHHYYWTSNEEKRYRLPGSLAATSLISIATLFFYNGFLRSPGYNWVILFSHLLLLLGILHSVNHQNYPGLLFGGILLSIAIVLGTAAKPSFLFFSILIIALARNLYLCIRNYFLLISISIVGLILSIITLRLSHFWPFIPSLDFVSYIIKMPSLVSAHNIFGAFITLCDEILTLFKPKLTIIFIFFTSMWLILLYYSSPEENRFKRRIMKSLSYLSALVLLINFSRLLPVFNSSFDVFNSKYISTFYFIYFSFYISLFTTLNIQRKFLFKIYSTSIKLVIFLFGSSVISVVSFSFGSSNSFRFMVQFAIVFLIILMLCLVYEYTSRKFYAIYIFTCSVLLAVLLSLILSASAKNAYRIGDLKKQLTPISIPKINGHTYIGEKLAKTIQTMKIELNKNGFKGSSNLITITSDNSGIGLNVMLGGDVVPSIHSFWSGYLNSNRQAYYMAIKNSHYYLDSKNFWVTDNFILDSSHESQNTREVLLGLSKKSLTDFMISHKIIYSDSKYLIWGPSSE
jgi:hypothetical protein